MDLVNSTLWNFPRLFLVKDVILGLIEAGGWAWFLLGFDSKEILKVEKCLQTCLYPSRLETRAKELIASERKRE